MSGATSSTSPAADRPQRKPLPHDLPLPVQAALLFRPESNPTGYVAFEHAGRFLFEPRASGVSRVNGWQLADAAWLAYARDMAMVSALLRDRVGLTTCRPLAGAGPLDRHHPGSVNSCCTPVNDCLHSWRPGRPDSRVIMPS